VPALKDNAFAKLILPDAATNRTSFVVILTPKTLGDYSAVGKNSGDILWESI